MTRLRPADQLGRDALQIWRAGLAGVDSARLVREAVRVERNQLVVEQETIELDAIKRIVVVGAGKAGAGMAAGLLEALGEKIVAQKALSGWLNVPADCVRPLAPLVLHSARPAGVNEPTEEGASDAREILRLVSSLSRDDLCIALVSGGASALLPAPVDEISLADKLAVTRHLSAAGATINELNTVRKQLSRIKGGGLARACLAGRLITLIISDVLGDPLDIIASGPTVPDPGTPRQALEILERFGAREAGISPRVFDYLRHKPQQTAASPSCEVTNIVIGNNATAVEAAGMEAERLGYSHAMTSARTSEGAAEDVGRHLAQMALSMRRGPGPDCLITGGEPVVKLPNASQRGLGGRNQQLVLAALESLAPQECAGVALLSGGTDGEDGPTDAAGALIDADVLASVRQLRLDPAEYLRRCDAYHFFEAVGALIKTGPTQTNVCDLRVVVVDRVEHGENSQ
jgi:hydroxypyruvate reductase